MAPDSFPRAGCVLTGGCVVLEYVRVFFKLMKEDRHSSSNRKKYNQKVFERQVHENGFHILARIFLDRI